jgi:REP element-mobilizing transposase RayT
MPRRPRIDYAGAVHHVAVNGNNRQPMFLDDTDRRRCLALLGECVERYGWEVRAFCLMDTHWHMVLRTPEKNLSQGMRRLNSCYSLGFNWRHERSGHSIRHRFMSVPVETDAHQRELTRYLPLNPVRGGLVGFPEAWRWSSYRCDIGLTAPPPWLVDGWSRKLHGSVERLRAYVAKGMAEPGAHEWTPGSDPTLTRPRPAGCTAPQRPAWA